MGKDLGAASQNMLLEAVHLGLGAVWLGVATSDVVTEQVRSFFSFRTTSNPSD